MANQGASTRNAEKSLIDNFNLDTKANVLGDRTFNTLQGVNQLVNTPIQERDSFKAGVARGEASYLNGLRNRSPVGVDLLSGVDVEGNISSAIRNREIAAIQTDKNIDNFVDGALAASYFIPGAGLLALGARGTVAGVKLLAAQTIRSTVTGVTLLAGSFEAGRNGVNALSDGVSFVAGDGVANQLNFSADARVGVFAEATKNDVKILETKVLTGTDVEPFAISLKSGYLEDNNFSGLGLPVNGSLRFDFENGFALPQTNIISEVDLGREFGFGKVAEIKPVLRQNITTGDTTFGTNTKLKIGPSFSFGTFDINTGLVFESRNSIPPHTNN